MPEGDNYARDAERLRPVLAGRVLERVDGGPAVRRNAPRLQGSRVTGIRTHGKHLLIDVEPDLAVHVWLGMSGYWRVASRREGSGGAARPGGSVRLLLETESHRATCAAAPIVEVDRRRVLDESLRRLGPDVLAEEFDWDLFHRRLRRLPGQTTVADVLLDQRILAGVGNEYKCEILFLERVHPLTPLSALEHPDSLAERARRIMRPNATVPGRRSTTGSRAIGQSTYVVGRTGKPCRRCRTAIMQAWIGRPHPRITYWCPACQPEAGASGDEPAVATGPPGV